MLQREDEICLNVNALKVIGLGNQQLRPEQGKAQRLFREEVDYKRSRSGGHLNQYWKDEDIVWTRMKVREVI